MNKSIKDKDTTTCSNDVILVPPKRPLLKLPFLPT